MARELIHADALATTIAESLRTYTDDVKHGIADAVRTTAKETAVVLRKTSPEMTGEYAKSWTFRTLWPGHAVVYAKLYQLTHLLEKGHAKRGGGRVRAYPHIGVAEDFAIQQVENRVEDIIREASR